MRDGCGLARWGAWPAWKRAKFVQLNTDEAVSALVVDGAGQVWSGGRHRARCTSGRARRRARSQWPKKAAPKRIAGLCEDGQGRIWVGTLQGRFGWIEAQRFTPLDEWDRRRSAAPCCRTKTGSSGSVSLEEYRRSTGTRMASCARRIWPRRSPSPMSTCCGNTKMPLWVGTAQGAFRPRSLVRAGAPLYSRTVPGCRLTASWRWRPTCRAMFGLGTSGGGVLRYDGETFQSIRLGPSALGNMVEAVLCDRAGRLWFGTRAGLVAYQPGRHAAALGDPRGDGRGTLLAAPEAVSCPEEYPGNPHSLPRYQLPHRREPDAL